MLTASAYGSEPSYARLRNQLWPCDPSSGNYLVLAGRSIKLRAVVERDRELLSFRPTLNLRSGALLLRASRPSPGSAFRRQFRLAEGPPRAELQPLV